MPIDAASLGEGFFTEPAKKFMHDGTAFGKLSHTSKVSEVSVADTDAIFCCGGHGTCVDFIDNGDLKSLIENMLSGGKVVAAVCHGPMCLVDCVKADGVIGAPWVVMWEVLKPHFNQRPCKWSCRPAGRCAVSAMFSRR